MSNPRHYTQVERDVSAKDLFVGSNPTGASIPKVDKMFGGIV